MNRAELLALAERCEAATGPDRAIDFAIFRTLHPEYAGPEWKEFAGGLRHVNDGSDIRCVPPASLTPSQWTASLDAALTLVPEGWDWCLSRGTGEPAVASMSPTDRVGGPCVTGATPALALCAAALRARAAKEGA